MANLSLVTENRPERELGFMSKGFEKIVGSWLRADRLCAMPVSFLTPENLWQEGEEGDSMHRNGNTMSAFFPLLLEKIELKNNTKRQTHAATANSEQL